MLNWFGNAYVKFWVIDIPPSIPSALPSLTPLPHHVSFLSASFSLPTGHSLEQKPQEGSGFVSSWRPQVTPAVEKASPSPLSPSPDLVLCGPPPSQPHIPQTALVSPSDHDAGTESKRHNESCCSCLISIDSTSPIYKHMTPPAGCFQQLNT